MIDRLARLSPTRRQQLLRNLSLLQRRRLIQAWRFRARPAQLPPPGDWFTWMIMGGRGFGKTRAGAEWVRMVAEGDPTARIALVGASLHEARAVMVEGESGLLAIATQGNEPKWFPAKRQLRWPGGACAMLYGAADPETLRGPQHSHAWADEIGKWPRGEAAWDNLAMGLRLGNRPAIVATTTPRAVPLVRRLAADPRVVVTRGSTRDNRGALPQSFLAEMERNFRGTRLGRQELDGELLLDHEGALWTRALIETCRLAGLVPERAELARVAVGVDPPASAGGDACGIIVAGIDQAGEAIVLEDASVEQASPQRWAQAVAHAAERWAADRIVAEANNGGEMVRTVLRGADRALPVRLVHAAQGKVARAEPIAAAYEAGRVRHARPFAMLEDQLCGLLINGRYEGPGRSPDRADALVWCLTELLLKTNPQARVRSL
ncbi:MULTISPECIES: DNA-packaging protein [Sphingobium]|uniref:DNA-packaging protein n=1 Tax=Sphingobium TaxID=165695 RepID=UPI0015ECB179|nr:MULTISPECIES: terminase family protein [Sphingobium]